MWNIVWRFCNEAFRKVDEEFVFHFFGFFDFLMDFCMGRLENRPPQKEGFLRKNSAYGEKFKKHWSCCRDGSFWYFQSDDKAYEVPARVVTLQKDCIIELVEAEPGFTMANGPYVRKFLCESKEDAQEWVNVLKSNMEASFNLRSGITCRWMVDGKDTFIEFHKALLWAKKNIYITDWFFSPFVYLLPGNNNDNRLDNILKAKAEEGVKIFVLLWNETKLALDINSHHAERYLESLHPNIKVMRHPIVTPMKWSHHQKTLCVDQKIAFVGGLDLAFGRYDDQYHLCVDREKKVWLGKNYYNPSIKAITKVEQPFDDLLDRQNHWRMPWHDVHAVCDGYAARDVARSFIDRWNHHKEALQKDDSYAYLVPSDDNCSRRGKMKVQVLRSISLWSAGVIQTESSIYAAYLRLIEKSEHFIYIENQFFISDTAGAEVQNKIASAIFNRIVKAATEQQIFRVVVVLPVTPEGSFLDDEAIRNIMLWQQKTISKGEQSLLGLLKKKFEGTEMDFNEFLTFHSLQSFGSLPSTNVTEQVYVHSKLLIIDDRTVIVGSANINDRSMLGDRDSEIALLIEDTEMERGIFNGLPYDVTRFAHELRVSLWKEHLGLNLMDGSVEDPITDDCFNFWKHRSRQNTEILRASFPKFPSNAIPTLEIYNQQQPLSQGIVNGVVGHLIDHPLNFLCDEKNMVLTGAASAVGVDVLV